MELPSGTILLWHGEILNIPDGFVLCDGTQGTPDLAGKFIIGAGDTLAVGTTGGSPSHTHTFNGQGHTHAHNGSTFLAAGSFFPYDIDEATVVGTTDGGSSYPPFHALCYIMKL